MADRLRLQEIIVPSDPAFRKAYTILREAFPASELVHISDFQRTLREAAAGVWSDMFWHMVVGARGSTVLGVATGTYLGSLNVGLIGYLAVQRGQRSSGLGPRLRNRLLKAFDQDANRLLGRSVDGVIGEVEPANPWLGRLVRHHDAIALDFPYFQPPVRSTEPEVPLVLYYQPLSHPRHRLPVSEVRQALYAIWRRGYRVTSPVDDPRFRKMLRSLEGRRWIGSRKLPPGHRMGPLHE